MFVLLFLAVAILCVIAVPLLLVGLVVRLAFSVLLLPFRIVAAAFGLAVGLGSMVFALLLTLFSGLMVAGVLLLIPLLPVIAIVGGIWLIVRLSKRASPARFATD